LPPALSISIFAASQSTHTTLWPTSAKHVPVTNPTYPVPLMLIFINPTLDSQGRLDCSSRYLLRLAESGASIVHARHRFVWHRLDKIKVNVPVLAAAPRLSNA